MRHLLAAVAVTAVGCSAASRSGIPAQAAPTSPSPVTAEKWSGQTSQMRPVSFYVSGAQVTGFTFSAEGSVQCGASSGGFEMGSIGGRAAISDGQFFFSSIAPGETTSRTPIAYGVEGTFTSDTLASGTITVTDTTRADCSTTVNLTWTAAKEQPS